MAVQKINAGTNEDGSPRWHYYAPDSHLVITGPITGSVELPDGTVYDVTPDVIEVAEEHRLAVSDAIGQRYADEGHASHQADQPFVHIPSSVSHSKKKG